MKLTNDSVNMDERGRRIEFTEIIGNLRLLTLVMWPLAKECRCSLEIGIGQEKDSSLEPPGEICCRKGDPFQGLRVGSSLTLRNELSEETSMLTKQKTLIL